MFEVAKSVDAHPEVYDKTNLRDTGGRSITGRSINPYQPIRPGDYIFGKASAADLLLLAGLIKKCFQVP